MQIRRKPTQTDPATTTEVHYEHTLDAVKKIVADEGISGLYAGMAGSLLGVSSTNFAYFYWYSVIRTLYMSSQTLPKPPSTAIELSLGAAAGAVAQVFTIPVAVITTRQQTQPKAERTGFWATGKEVVDSEDGWSGLWRGLKASLVLVINPAITYGAYQRLRTILFPGKVSLKPWESFGRFSSLSLCIILILPIVLGAMSKALATIATQPLIVAKVGLQSRPPPARNGKKFKSFLEVMEFIVEHDGPMGLFKGIGPQILKGILVQGLLMMTKERMELLFIVLFAYLRQVRAKQLQKLADLAASKAAAASEKAKSVLPVTMK